jgi:head-tail adaptor
MQFENRETNKNKFSKSFQVIDDQLIIENCVTENQENSETEMSEYMHRIKINFKSIISISFSFSKILKIQNLLGLTNLKVTKAVLENVIW